MSGRVDLAPLPAALIGKAVAEALGEDLGLAGDITTAATVAADVEALATIGLRQAGVVSGLDVAAAAFAALDGSVGFERLATDGDALEAGTIVARIAGNARAMLTAERVALNFLGRMGGVATLTRAFVDAIEGTGAAIADTRKTTPGLRAFEKYAVKCGGGVNHRFGLFDAILIKDNHIVAAGGLVDAIRLARRHAGHTVKIEIEVDTLDQLEEAISAGADIVLLDNMTAVELKEAVRMANGQALLEASGGVTLQTVRQIAETGVDLISVGALTHSAPVLDLGLDFQA